MTLSKLILRWICRVSKISVHTERHGGNLQSLTYNSAGPHLWKITLQALHDPGRAPKMSRNGDGVASRQFIISIYGLRPNLGVS